MKHWRIITHTGRPLLSDKDGHEIAVEADRVVTENGVARFFKEGSEIPFLFVNLYGISTISCEADVGTNRMIVLPPPVEPLQATKLGSVVK